MSDPQKSRPRSKNGREWDKILIVFIMSRVGITAVSCLPHRNIALNYRVWSFGELIKELQTKVIEGLAVLSRVAGTTWGPESRISTTAKHVLNYGLAVTGTQTRDKKRDKIAKVARNVVGTAPKIGR